MVMTPYERARGKAYAETFRCPGGELCLDFCNTGQEARDKPGEENLRLIEQEYARTAPCARLVPSDSGFSWSVDRESDELDSALRPVLDSAVALMTSERMRRVRRCGNATCYWLFVDETKNCSRRWCEMASCGNVMKVRRHRERHRAA